jgi:hypothetical protein
MNHSRGRMSAWTMTAVLACLLLPAAATAEMMIPVTVRITELWQLDHDQDPGLFGIGQSVADFYAEVTINGTTLNNFDQRCDNPPATPPANEVFDVPLPFFTENDPFVDPSCPNVPDAWTFTVDVPLKSLVGLSKTIDVVIRIKDSDSGSDDDVAATINLKVPFGGRWSGDFEWPKNCNRAAVEGSGARVCWRIETGKDSDGDGLLDDWEIHGIDIDGDGIIDIDLPAMGADPMHKDLFLEIDWVPGFQPTRDAIQQLKQAYAAAPIDAGGVPNPDGKPGITLHVDTGSLTENGLLVGDNLGGGSALPAGVPVCGLVELAAQKALHFNANRRLAFRYAITAYRCCQGGPNAGNVCTLNTQCAPGTCSPGGIADNLPGTSFVSFNRDFQGSNLMHEFGHTLGLAHGGALSQSLVNCKPNYLSVMNYSYSEIDSLVGPPIIDYSPPRKSNGTRGQAPLDPLDERHLNETLALDPSDAEHLIAFVNGGGALRSSPVAAPVDWNGDGDAADTNVSVNTDANLEVGCDGNGGINSSLPGFDDWANVNLQVVQFGLPLALAPASARELTAELVASHRDPTDDEILELRQALNTADLSIASSGNPGPYEAGTDVVLSYVHKATNHGPNPALPPRVRDTLPPGATLLSADPACVQDSASQLTCTLPSLLPGGEAGFPMSVRARAACAGGVPTPIVNRASVENAARHAGPDPDPANNTARFETAVVDTTPPQLTLSASPSVLWPPDHKFVPVTITVTTSDACDDHPAIRLVSITSNEAADAGGSGNISPDIQGAAFGTDDRQFLLRAERSGQGAGRVYTITYEAKDGSGNATTSAVTVTVPKSQASP